MSPPYLGSLPVDPEKYAALGTKVDAVSSRRRSDSGRRVDRYACDFCPFVDIDDMQLAITTGYERAVASDGGSAPDLIGDFVLPIQLAGLRFQAVQRGILRTNKDLVFVKVGTLVNLGLRFELPLQLAVGRIDTVQHTIEVTNVKQTLPDGWCGDKSAVRLVLPLQFAVVKI